MKRKYFLLTFLYTLMLLSLPLSVAGADALPPQMQAAPINSASTPIVQDNIIISQVDYFEVAPKAAYNSVQNEYLVVWQHEDDSTKFGVYAQRVGIDGTLLSPIPITLAHDSGFNQKDPVAAYDPVNDRYLVVWTKEITLTASELLGRFVNADGSLSTPVFTVAQSGAYSHHSAKVAYGTTAGDFMVTWSLEDSTGIGVAAQVIPGDGSAINAATWTTVAYSPDPETREHPDIAYNGAYDEFDIVYQRLVDGDNDIYAARLLPDGTQVAACRDYGTPDPECSIFAEDVVEETYPTIASCENIAKTVILWQRDAGSGEDIIGQMSTTADMSFYNYISLAGTSGVDEAYPVVVCNYAGSEFMSIWQEWNADVGKSLFGRSINEGGSAGTVVAIKAPATTYTYYSGPSGLAGGKTNYFAVWEQERIGQGLADIHGSFIVPNMVFMPLALKMP